jgi:hypothetical protein
MLAVTVVPSLVLAAEDRNQHGVGRNDAPEMPVAKPTAKRKPAAKALQGKHRRLESAAPPSQEDLLAAFELFNQQRMPAIIASDIEKVMCMRCVRGSAIVESEYGRIVQPNNTHFDVSLMSGAGGERHTGHGSGSGAAAQHDGTRLRPARMTLCDFTRLVRHFCG